MSESEDEAAPLLPSLEEEFDKDSGGKATQVKTKEGRQRHVALMVAVIGMVVALVVVAVVVGITIPLVERANQHGGGIKVSSAFPTHSARTTTSSSSGNTQVSSHLQPGMTTLSLSTTSVDLSPSPTYAPISLSSLPLRKSDVTKTLQPTMTTSMVLSSSILSYFYTSHTSVVHSSSIP